jgi:hypothetical protein
MADTRNGFARFTLQEFRVCVRAIFAFGAGYKLGERYKLGALERRLGQSWDPSASYSPKGPKVGPIPTMRQSLSFSNLYKSRGAV